MEQILYYMNHEVEIKTIVEQLGRVAMGLFRARSGYDLRSWANVLRMVAKTLDDEARRQQERVKTFAAGVDHPECAFHFRTFKTYCNGCREAQSVQPELAVAA